MAWRGVARPIPTKREGRKPRHGLCDGMTHTQTHIQTYTRAHTLTYLDERVRVPDGAAVVGDDVGHLVGRDGVLVDAAELVVALLRALLQALQVEAALHVVEQPELVARLLDRHDVCVVWVCEYACVLRE